MEKFTEKFHLKTGLGWELRDQNPLDGKYRLIRGKHEGSDNTDTRNFGSHPVVKTRGKGHHIKVKLPISI